MGRPKKTALKPKTKPKVNDREPHLRPAFLVAWYEGGEKRGKFFDNENAAHCYRVSKIVDSVAADAAHEPHEEADMALDVLKQVMLYGSGNDGAGERRDEIFVSPVIDPKEAAALQRQEFAKGDKEFNERVELNEQREMNETRELLKTDLEVRLGAGLKALLGRSLRRRRMLSMPMQRQEKFPVLTGRGTSTRPGKLSAKNSPQ